MSVDLNPQELGFRRPFSHEVTQVLRLANNNAGSVAFKVKTTAPKQYCVRPNSGLIKANDTVDVQVLLQAMKEDPPLDARCRDKFLVQSVLVDDSEESNVATLWSNVEKTSKGSIQEQKIRVQFLPAGESSHLNGATTGAYTSTPTSAHSGATSAYQGVTVGDQPPAYDSPTPAYGSPAPASSSDAKSTSMAESAQSTASNAAEATGLSGAATAVSNSIPRNQNDLNQQLSAAQARIQDLTNQLSDPQIRQRKVNEAQEKVQTVVQQAQDTGVPLHIVAALCLVSFLIAYLFF